MKEGERDFGLQFTSLLSKETRQSAKDPDRMADLIERLASALGFAIAVAARGEPAVIDTLMIGAEAHATNEAIAKAPMAQFLASIA